VPGHIESGRAIRALQAKTSRLNIKVKRHIEAGLQRATQLRLHNIMQFMRGTRVFEVTDSAAEQKKLLFMGWDEQEIAGYYDLQRGQHEDGKEGWMTPQGDEVEILVLNDQIARDAISERVRLTLDTGHKANQLERQEQAEMVLNIVGPAAIPWAAKQLEWSNAEELVEAIEARDEAMQMAAMAEEFAKKTGISAMEALQKLMQQMENPAPPAPPPAPGGNPPPPGPGAGGAPPRRVNVTPIGAGESAPPPIPDEPRMPGQPRATVPPAQGEAR